jgi:hypothetical protein
MGSSIRAGLFKSLLSPYEWLPPEGEIAIAVRYKAAELFVDVVFENDDETTRQSKTFVFSGVCAFYVASIPGPDLLAVEFEKVASSGDLVEYEESAAAQAWSDHLQYRRVRHFEIFFLSTNQRLEVFAQAFRLETSV